VKKVLLIIRLLVEAVFGLICMIAFPQQFILVILDYLGMPHLYHPAELQRFSVVITLGGFLWVTIVLLIGVLCFKDVFKMIQKLRVGHPES
jgi:hypothetical protein